MHVTFDFTGDDGPRDTIAVADCPQDLYEQLLDAAAGNDGDSVFRVRASANGGEPRMMLFRAARVSNVQVTP